MIGIVLMVAQAVAAPALPAVFGLQLGAPVALPECKRMAERYPIPGEPAPYESVQTVTCQELPGQLGPGSEHIGWIVFLPAELPEILGGNSVGTRISGGALQGIYASTLSRNSAQGIVAQLSAKFGSPASSRAETVLIEKIPVPSMDVTWSRPGFTVEYHSVSDDIDHGYLTIETDAAKGEREAEDRARAARRTPL